MASGVAVVFARSDLAFAGGGSGTEKCELLCLSGVCDAGVFMPWFLWIFLASGMGSLFDDPVILFFDFLVQRQSGGG